MVWEFRAKREYLRTLRLVSELPDLRVADANPHRAPKAHDEWVDGRTGNQKEKPKPNKSVKVFLGDPYGNRTHVFAVKGRCLSRLTNGP